MPVAIDIPVIETPRTILRAHRLDDFDAYAAMWADPVVTRFIAGGKPRTREAGCASCAIPACGR
jgi:RimJ/RimL family protein N-acetyltransferase